MSNEELMDKIRNIFQANDLFIVGSGPAMLELLELVKAEKSMSYNMGFTDGERRIVRGA